MPWQSKGNTLHQAIVPDSDDDTPDADITIVAHNSIFDPLDGSQSEQRGTPNSEIEIDELKSERTATSVANLKDTQAKGTTTVKPSRKKQKPNQSGAYMHIASELLLAAHHLSFGIIPSTCI